MMRVLKAAEDEPPSLTVRQCGVWCHPPHVVYVSFDELRKQTQEHKISCTEWKRAGGRRYWRAAHHGGSSARLQAAQPGHVDGRPGAAVGVGRAAVQRAEVVPRVHYQEIIRPVTEHKLNLLITNTRSRMLLEWLRDSPFDLRLRLVIDPRQHLSGEDGGHVQLLDVVCGGDH